jgi:hypothetical protein
MKMSLAANLGFCVLALAAPSPVSSAGALAPRLFVAENTGRRIQMKKQTGRTI